MKLNYLAPLVFIFTLWSPLVYAELQPKYGGFIFEVGHDIALLEVVHKTQEGVVLMYFSKPDNLTPLALDKPPRINLSTSKGRQQVKTSVTLNARPQLSQFFTQHDLLIGQVKGEITVKIKGVHYLVKF